MRIKINTLFLFYLILTFSSCRSPQECGPLRDGELEKISEALTRSGHLVTARALTTHTTVYSTKEDTLITIISGEDELVEKLILERELVEKNASLVFGHQVKFGIIHDTKNGVKDR